MSDADATPRKRTRVSEPTDGELRCNYEMMLRRLNGVMAEAEQITRRRYYRMLGEEGIKVPTAVVAGGFIVGCARFEDRKLYDCADVDLICLPGCGREIREVLEKAGMKMTQELDQHFASDNAHFKKTGVLEYIERWEFERPCSHIHQHAIDLIVVKDVMKVVSSFDLDVCAARLDLGTGEFTIPPGVYVGEMRKTAPCWGWRIEKYEERGFELVQDATPPSQ